MSTSLQGIKLSFFRNNALLKKIFIFYTVWWIAIFCLGTYSLARIHAPARPTPGSAYLGPEWSKTFVNFDGGWYYAIATEGYPRELNSRQVFYPLFPLSVAVVSRLGLSPPVAALVINYLAGLVASVFFVLLYRDFSGKPEGAEQALPFLLFFPSAFVLLAFYSEALFLALMLSSFYFGRRGKWWLACLLVGALTAVRLPGVVVAVALFVEYLSQRDFTFSRMDRQAAWFGLAPLGILAYAAYLHIHTGDAFAMIHAYSLEDWPYMQLNANILGTIWAQLAKLLSILMEPGARSIEQFANVGFPLAFWLAGLVITIALRKKLRASYLVFMIISLIIFALNSNFVSSNRYAITYFPVIFIIAQYCICKREYYGLAVGVFAVIMAVWMVLFVNGFFVI